MKDHVLLFLAAISLPAIAQVPSNVPTNGLVAWYSLAGNADDGSANGLDGSGIGTVGTTDRQGVANGAMAFAFSSYMSVPTNALFNTGDELTVTAWVNLSDPSANQKIIGRTDLAFNSGFILGVGNGGMNPELWDSNGMPHSFTAGVINADAWTHLAITWSAGGGLTAYINGTSVLNVAGDGAPMGSNSDPLIIGGSPWSQSPLYFPVNGSIDDIGIWDRVLSGSEIDGLVAPATGITDAATTAHPMVAYDAAHELVTITGGSGHYALVDALGNLVRTDRLVDGITVVPVSALATGMYFVRLDGTAPSTQRFVKP